MGQSLSTSLPGQQAIPGTYDFSNESQSVFSDLRNVNIQGGTFNHAGRDLNMIINNYHSSASTADARLAKLRSRLAPNVNFRTIHSDVRKRRTAGTGMWLLESRLYREWKKSKGGIIWWMGIPGAGKTVMASAIVDDLLPLENDPERTCVLFVYSRYNEPLAITDILKALVKQCIERNTDLAAIVESFYDQYTLEETEPSVDELVILLQTLECHFDRVYYVIDGVDEALVDVQFDLIQVINKLQGNIILTSRPLDELSEDLKHAVFCKITAHDRDIGLLMEEKLQRYKALRRILDKNNCREEVLKSIAEKAQGMFLHAALQLDAIQDCTTLASIRATLSQFPAGLHGMYSASMERIELQTPQLRDLAKQVLLWLVFSRGPLSIDDLRYALAADPETHAYIPERMPDEATIVSVCCGLVEVQETSNTVRLIHFTAKDALVPLLLRDYPTPHLTISKVLIQRLLSSGIVDSEFTVVEELHDAWKQHHLLRYAQENLGSHIRECPLFEVSDAVVDFLSHCTAYPVEISPGGFDILAPPHVATYYNLKGYLKGVSSSDQGLDLRTRCLGRTMLHIAAWVGDEQTAEEVLTASHVDVNAADSQGWTALMLASRNGHVRVAARLLRAPGIRVDAARPHGWTAATMASLNGRSAIIEELLQVPGIDFNAPGPEGWTALMLAVAGGDERTVENILQFPGIDVNAVNDDGVTALMYALSLGRNALATRILKVPGLDVNAAAKNGYSTLTLASECGSDEIVSALLQFPGIQVNSADEHGWTALLSASIKGHDGAVDALLMVPGIDVNAVNSDGQTALMVASYQGHVRIVERLLQHPGIQVEMADHLGRTALMWASMQGHAVIADRLLQVPGIKVNATTNDGWTALMFASDQGHDTVVTKLLQSPGILANVTEKEGWTALMFASSNGQDTVADKLLRVPGILANTSDQDGRTTLMLASSNGHDGIVDRLLRIPGVDVNAVDKDGWTALMFASAPNGGHASIARRLLRFPGIDPHLRDGHNSTALTLASEGDHREIVSLLLECDGIDVNAADRDGDTSLIMASRDGHEGIVELLLGCKGIDLDLRNEEGLTALSAAQQNGHGAIVERLIRFQESSRMGGPDVCSLMVPGRIAAREYS
ncbi:ankyrin repeat domain-containing protein 50, variant 2 [Coprinopsis cinerea AmutBmut pab1-1]|nr:ankyrin repeat domain-containing protein 50, variant 2 [Coprinopsis cinerea AmutBmut pab1-1]